MKGNNTWVRLLSLPVEGNLTNSKGGKVGQKVKVELVAANAPKGYIDFKLIGCDEKNGPQIIDKRDRSKSRGNERNGSQDREKNPKDRKDIKQKMAKS